MTTYVTSNDHPFFEKPDDEQDGKQEYLFIAPIALVGGDEIEFNPITKQVTKVTREGVVIWKV